MAARKADTPPNFFGSVKDRPRFTGRRMLTLEPQAGTASTLRKFSQKASLNVASIRDFSSDLSGYQQAFAQADGLYFDHFKIAIINQNRNEQVQYLESSGTTPLLASEPERCVYALQQPVAPARKAAKSAIIPDSDQFTWGATAIRIPRINSTGKGVNIAVLDTGLNLSHPDFKRVPVVSKSFIRRESVEDRNGHGTHCCGIAVGGINSKTGQRYGVATDASLFVGKVLSNSGTGSDSGILAGIEWALLNKCKVISMSLGAAVYPGETYSPAYERVARTALGMGTIIIAAAGNESERKYGLISPVGHPANCPSILSVAALDSALKVADFSCGAVNDEEGSQVDIAAPGVNILSSWKGKKYATISGTSMATPFVAGVAALYWQARPKSQAADIWMMLTQYAKRLRLHATDIGAGLVQAR